LYKSDKGIGRSEQKKTNTSMAAKDAARAVNTTAPKTLPETDSDTSKWRESTVADLSPEEYEKHADDIMESIRSGQFIYDVSGNAR